MHTHRRLLIALTLCMVVLPVLPLRLTGLLSLVDREEARDTLDEAIGSAASEYRLRGGLQTKLERGKEALTSAEIRVRELEQKKIALRTEILKLRRITQTIEKRHGIELVSLATATALRDATQSRTVALLRRRASARIAGMSLIPLFNVSWTTKDEVVLAVQQRFLKDLDAAVDVLTRRTVAMEEREKTLTLYAAAEQTLDTAATLVRVSAEQIDENRRIMADVHAQVLSLQGDLARIDAKLRQKASRVLVQKGILDAEDVLHGSAPSASFSWPVYGRISAGFMNVPYVARFGVQHYGADIVVPQGTPVASAADGVVFLVRDGGATGYTYILIGHRDGYATLYGHINEALVQAGDEVDVGETIGLSGGKPGTRGAGPMTTAAHLHFEMILNGKNIDPLSVLP